MRQILRVLQVEDSESDAALIVRLLERAGYSVEAHRLEDPEAMRAALQRRTWDIVIADHQMACFDAPGALEILHETGLDIPFVVVSGSIGEELAVRMMKSGAHDYVLKDNLSRLVPAVERELREAQSRRERRQAEQDLRESEERLALAIEATRMGTFDFFPQVGRMICSELTKRHFGLPAHAEFNYDIFLSGLHPEDRERVHAMVRDLLQPGSGGHYATEYRTVGIEDGIDRHICAWGRVLFDTEGQAVRFVGVTLDATERKGLEAQFRQAQKMESVARLAGGVAHDFNNLLTVINGYSDMVLQDLPASDEHYDSIMEIRTAGERAAALSGQLLVLSRKQVVQPKEVNLNDIIVEVEKMLGRVIGEEIRLESVLSPTLGCVLADPGQLHQVLMNLSINARDAMPAGGTLRIETRNMDLEAGASGPDSGMKPGGYVELIVTDTGVGMSKEVISHLFEPFFTTKKAGEGTGLGLATVYGIVQQCGGSISVSSEPGAGTSFRIFLPRIERAGPAPEKVAREAMAVRGTETILVVEDQEQVRKMAVRVLRDCGYQVIEAAGPEEALARSEGHSGPIHLMLTDVVMPGLSGRELAGRMKLQRPSLEIIFMSGYSEQTVLDRQMLDSEAAYLGKPFSPEVLAVKVRELLDTGHNGVPIRVEDGDADVRSPAGGTGGQPGERDFYPR